MYVYMYINYVNVYTLTNIILIYSMMSHYLEDNTYYKVV